MPKGIVRSAGEQNKINDACAAMALYHFYACPFCIKVRHEMARLSLPIKLLDALQDSENRNDLIKGGGKFQTPCLKITGEDGSVQWMYESSDIIKYLQQRFPGN